MNVSSSTKSFLHIKYKPFALAYSTILRYMLVSSMQIINIGKTSNQNPTEHAKDIVCHSFTSDVTSVVRYSSVLCLPTLVRYENALHKI